MTQKTNTWVARISAWYSAGLWMAAHVQNAVHNPHAKPLLTQAEADKILSANGVG